jgi:predicted Zn-dependent peptidase
MKRALSVLLASAAAACLAAACGGSSPTARTAAGTTPTAAAAGSTTPPSPVGDAPPTVDGAVTVGTAAGIPVIVKRVPGAEFAAGQLWVRGGARNWSAANAGIEALAFAVAAQGGTRSLDKSAFARKSAKLGLELSANAGNDSSFVAMKVPLAAWDDAFSVEADVFRTPALPASEVELARQQTLAQLHGEAEQPDGRLWTLERAQIFAGHPYANRPIGTLDTVTALKAEDLEPYMAKLRVKSRLVFIAVGDLDAAHVFDQVRRAYGDLPQGDYAEAPMPPYDWSKSRIVTEQRKIPTNYVDSAFLMPGWADPDFVTARVAVSALSHRVWEEVRTKRNLAYAAFVNDNTAFGHPFANFYFSSVDPNAAMKVMLDVARDLQNVLIPDAELAGYKAVFLTGYLQEHETVEGQAFSLSEAQLLGGSYRLAAGVPDRVRAITAADIQAFARKYIAHLQAAVLGDPTKVDPSIFTSL